MEMSGKNLQNIDYRSAAYMHDHLSQLHKTLCSLSVVNVTYTTQIQVTKRIRYKIHYAEYYIIFFVLLYHGVCNHSPFEPGLTLTLSGEDSTSP